MLVRLRPLSSLRARLALWYLLLFGAILALFGAGIFLEVRGSLLSGVDTVLQTRAETVLGQVGMGPRGPRYRGSEALTLESESAVYLFDTHGRLLERIANSTEAPPEPRALGPALHGYDGGTTIGDVRYYSAALYDHGRPAGAVQVAQSLRTITGELNELLAVLLLAAPALLAVATIGGIFLAGRALAPIDRIMGTARAIGATNLAGRLGLAPRDDEVGRLAATFDGMLDRLERAFVQQEQAVSQQRRFVADASHELRTPLTIIRGDLDVLLRRRRAPEEYEEVVGGVNDEVTRLSRLVDDLLTLARADSGQAEVARDFVYLDALVTEVAAGPHRLAEAQGITMEARLERDVALLGDPTRLRQLVLNLLGNAVQYTPAGGRVTVALTTEGATTARLAISDTGIGIAPDDLPRVFDRFYRADRARTHSHGGTGLGLSIARWCAEAHGGRIEVESRLGEGSTFTVSLPLAPTDDAAIGANRDGGDGEGIGVLGASPSEAGGAAAAPRE